MLKEIKPIKVDGKEYMITLLLFKRNTNEFDNKGHFCAYVYLPKIKVKEQMREDFEELSNETFRRGKVVGIDTAHAHNENMTMKEKQKDAYRQIRGIIKDYHKRLKKKVNNNEISF